MSPRKVDNWKILSDEGERLSNVLMPENDSENKKEKPKHRNKNLILLANCKLVAPEMMTILFLVKSKPGSQWHVTLHHIANTCIL
jgi:hypothetical protein